MNWGSSDVGTLRFAHPTSWGFRRTPSSRHTSIIVGLSTRVRNAPRSCAPSAPSTARWSVESVTVIWVAMASLPSRTTGALLAGADRQDGRVRRIDHGGELLDAVHAEIGDRGRAALVFLGLELARPGAGGEDPSSRREIAVSDFGLGLADDRRDQAAGDRDRDADVGVLVLEHAGLRSRSTLASGTFISASAIALMTKSLTESLQAGLPSAPLGAVALMSSRAASSLSMVQVTVR